MIDLTSYLKFFTQILYENSEIVGNSYVKVPKVQFKDKSSFDTKRQNILRNLNIHEIVIKLIKDSIHLIEEGENPEFEILKDLFKNCYSFLINFVINNPINQEILSEDLVNFVVNISGESLGQLELINEIFRNNKKICIEFFEDISQDFVDLIIENGRKAKYLEFFKIVMRNFDCPIILNQKLTLNLFFNSKHKKDLLFLLPNKGKVYEHEFEYFFF